MAPDSTTMKASVLLMATVVLLAMAVHGKNEGGCIRRVGEIETPLPGSCLCYDKCARKGGDQAGLTGAVPELLRGLRAQGRRLGLLP